MNCNQAKEHFLGTIPPGTEVAAHVASCAECAAELAALKSTMELMDAWQAPEASAHFNTRLKARLAEARREEASAPQGWLSSLWRPMFLRPALVAAMGLAFVIGINLYQPSMPESPKDMAVAAQKGTAVADLQALDKNQDLYDDFDLLDDIGKNHAQGNTTNRAAGSEL